MREEEGGTEREREKESGQEGGNERGSDKGAGNRGSHPLSPILLAPLSSPRSDPSDLSFLPRNPRPVCSPCRAILAFLSRFLLLPPSTSLSRLAVPLPPRSLAVSLTLSALRLFTLLIPQHPPRNNDVRPCFSCFFPYLSLSFHGTSLFLTADLFPCLIPIASLLPLASSSLSLFLATAVFFSQQTSRYRV